MNSDLVRLKDINPAKFIIEDNPFNIDIESLAGIFMSNIATGQEVDKIVLDMMAQIPESQKNTSTQAEVQSFVDNTLVRLVHTHLKADISAGGFIKDSQIIKKPFFNLENGKLKQVNALVLHRTDSWTAKGTLAGYETSTKGAHFLIDNDGTIYQTASLNKKTQHVGPIKSKCYQEDTCDVVEKNDIKKMENRITGKKEDKMPMQIHNHEKTKKYPDRFPYNADSIGIEVVGKHDDKKGYGPPTPQQLESLKYLTTVLQNHYDLTHDDVYTHGSIARKKESEGKFMGF